MSKYQRLVQRRNSVSNDIRADDPNTSVLASIVRDVIRQELACFQSSDDRPRLVDRAEIARELSASVATVDRLCRDGMPYVRLGEVRRFELKSVLAWLQERSREGRSS